MERANPEVWHRDWYCFYSAGLTFLETGAESAYAGQCIDNYYWLYPPYMLYPYALVSSFFTPPIAYFAAVAVILVLTASALRLLGASLPGRRPFETIALFVLASAAFFATLVTGQHSAGLLLGVAGALWAMRRDRDFAAGLFLGLLGIKPNWAAIFVVWLLVTRRWRTLGGMVLVGVLLVLSTLPMGGGAWAEYLAAGPRAVADLLDGSAGELSYPAHKLMTIEAFTRSTIGTASSLGGTVAWVLLELFAIGAGLSIWLRSADARDQVVAAVLVAVAANIYVEFYDVLVLAVPAAVWWTAGERYPGWAWRTIGAVAGVIWLWQWTWTIGSPGPAWPSLVGAFVTVWLGVEALRVWRHPAEAGSRGSRPDAHPPAAG